MKKIVRLKESDLQRIVKRVMKESQNSILNELGGMDDGHPELGNLNFGNLSPEERKRMNKYYRFSDEDDKWNVPSPDDNYEDDYEDELRIDDDIPSYKTKWNMSSDEEDEYPEPKRIFNRNSERPFRPRPFNID